MMKSIEDYQKLGKEGVDATVQSLTAASKGAQAIATEFADYTRKNFEESSALVEKLVGARTLERAIEVQSEYAKKLYEGFVTETTKIGEIYADIAKQSYKPIEAYASKLTPTT
jgi:phasin family protein